MISKEQVEKIADLARLTLTENEIEKLSGELTQIVDYVEQLAELDLKDVRPMAHAVSVENVFRDDKPRDAGVVEDVLKKAPEHDDDYFLVPQVLK